MDKTIFLELFRFDIKTDYLPYFAKVVLKMDLSKTIKDLLKEVESRLENYRYNAYGFKINGVVVFDFSLKLESLVKNFGTSWKIEPLNPHLAIKDLEINAFPFLNKLEPLRELELDELVQDEFEGKESFFDTFRFDGTYSLADAFLLSFLPFAYATPLAVENPKYLGEAFFILAASLYAKHKTNDILNAVSNKEIGILNAQSLHPYIFPQNDKFDLCINEFKTILFERSELAEIKNFKENLIKRFKGN
ncbi:MAG: DUF5644 domain-containing protein [Helicobacter sp.]|nr:DUF5644 domain-containing protein [Helicobacter sp.]